MLNKILSSSWLIPVSYTVIGWGVTYTYCTLDKYRLIAKNIAQEDIIDHLHGANRNALNIISDLNKENQHILNIISDLNKKNNS